MQNPQTRILIIEDNADDEFLLLRQLKKAGLDQHVKVIAGGKEAIEFLEASATSNEGLIAVFLDLKLPDMSGITILERIRSTVKIRELPVIVMTSSNSSKDMERCRELGVASYVQKPVTYMTFTKAVADSFQALPAQFDSLNQSVRTIE